MYLMLRVVVFLQILQSARTIRTLSEILSYYETLKSSDFSHKIIRRDLSDKPHMRHLKFKSHMTNFNIQLVQSRSIFSPGFMAVSIDKNGKEHAVNIDRESYYEGFEETDFSSYAVAHIERGMLTATLKMFNETYVVEPLWRHNQSQNNEMLIYKTSDLIHNMDFPHMSVANKSFCGAFNEGYSKEINNSDNLKSRVRRDESTKKKNRCTLKLVADYLFFVNMGGKSSPTTLNYMVQVASRVNVIYKETNFPGIGKNIGFSIQKAVVHTAYSKRGFNKKRESTWNEQSLLYEFSLEDFSEVCLAHLFTYQDFNRGVIGLAYVASTQLASVGGICTDAYTTGRYLNCGLNSGLNWGRRLLTIESDLVTAHELGHNFGSAHDPNDNECSPDIDNGGKYIMYATSVSGERKNNQLFSSCSIKQMASVLVAKKDRCFSEELNSYCGNRVVEEPEEECDAGIGGGDNCCDGNCKLRNKAYQCSDANNLCCKNCFYAQSSVVCRERFARDCKDETLCNGTSADCPEAPPLSGEYDCGFGKGKCQEGKCVSLCEQYNKVSCACVAGKEACQICCKTKQKKCSPLIISGNATLEEDGIPCNRLDQPGQCVKGICEKAQQDVQDEFSSLLTDFTFSKFARFMKANIVGTILVFSLLVWVPTSCIVNYLDKKQEEADKEMRHWVNPKNTALIRKIKPKLKVFFSGHERKLPRSQYHISS